MKGFFFVFVALLSHLKFLLVLRVGFDLNFGVNGPDAMVVGDVKFKWDDRRTGKSKTRNWSVKSKAKEPITRRRGEASFNIEVLEHSVTNLPRTRGN